MVTRGSVIGQVTLACGDMSGGAAGGGSVQPPQSVHTVQRALGHERPCAAGLSRARGRPFAGLWPEGSELSAPGLPLQSMNSHKELHARTGRVPLHHKI